MMPIKTKKGIELTMWILIALVLAIVVFLIYFVFIRGGFLQFGSLADKIFGGIKE